MEESILKSTKKMLGLGADDTSFDQDILTHINSAFSHLQQLGIGPDAGYAIQDATPEWADYLPDVEPEDPILNAVKTNIHLQVRLVFDPPATSFVLTALEKQLLESDVRLNMLREATEWVNPFPASDPDLLDGMIIDGGDPGDE